MWVLVDFEYSHDAIVVIDPRGDGPSFALDSKSRAERPVR